MRDYAVQDCSTYGCYNPIWEKHPESRKCKEHYVPFKGSRRKETLPDDWGTIRRIQLRKHPYCAVDGCNEKATSVDHIKRWAGDREDNLQSLCWDHHNQKTIVEAHEARYGGNRLIPFSGEDPRIKLPANYNDIVKKFLEKNPECACGEKSVWVLHVLPANNHTPANLRPVCRVCYNRGVEREADSFSITKPKERANHDPRNIRRNQGFLPQNVGRLY